MCSCGAKGEDFDFIKSRDTWICLIGFPSIGKSPLLNILTNTFSEVQEREFTTLICMPGVIRYRWNKLQLLDFQVLSKEPKMEKEKEEKL